jgi:hypothetical protein
VGSLEFGGFSEGLNRVFDGSTETVEELAALNERGCVLKTNATGSEVLIAEIDSDSVGFGECGWVAIKTDRQLLF